LIRPSGSEIWRIYQKEGVNMTFRFRGKRYRIRPERIEKIKDAAYVIFAALVFGGFSVAFVYGWATGLMAW
jgi:hypothetical protein